MNHPRVLATPLPQMLGDQSDLLRDHGSLYLTAAALCLILALVLIKRALAPIMALIQAMAAAFAAAIAVLAALLLLAAVAFGG